MATASRWSAKPVAGLGPPHEPGAADVVELRQRRRAPTTWPAAVTANGGQVFVPPMDVIDRRAHGRVRRSGRRRVLRVAGRTSTRVRQLVNEPGTFSWSELITTDVPASKAFYGAVFGWGAEPTATGPAPTPSGRWAGARSAG